jgi:enterobacteria phage integrase
MAEVTLPYVNIKCDRHGRAKYYYFRHKRRLERLPGEPLSEEFMARYHELVAAVEHGEETPALSDRRAFRAGSFGALVRDYLASACFKEKAQSTQDLYGRILDQLSAEHGHKSIHTLRRRHIRKMRDARAETPGAANNVLRLLKIVLYFAVDEELLEVNPAARVKELEGGEYRSWTDAELAQFEARWKPGTMQRRAFAIALYTGQRKSDQVAMTRSHRSGGVIQVQQQKTDESLWIPEHPELTAELALGEQGHMSLLTTSRGKAFDPIYYGAWFADAIEDAGLPDDCVLHGLRKCAARHLAESGCSESEIMSITGHRTSRMVAHYTKDANKKKQASAAIIKLQTRGKS